MIRQCARDDLQWTKKDNSIRPIYLKWNGVRPIYLKWTTSTEILSMEITSKRYFIWCAFWQIYTLKICYCSKDCVFMATSALRLLALRGWRTLCVRRRLPSVAWRWHWLIIREISSLNMSILVLKSISLEKSPNLLIFKILMSNDDVITK